MIILDYKTIEKINYLNNCAKLPISSCFDYIDSLEIKDNGKYAVTIFVEPAGEVTKTGNSFSEILDWWIGVFESQPEDLDYCGAGWYLSSIQDTLPDNFNEIWKHLKSSTKTRES